MTISQPSAPDRSPEPRSVRLVEDSWIAGVCSGLAAHLGAPVVVVRLLFLILGITRLIGVVLYLVLWLSMPRQADRGEAPGLDAFARKGLRARAVRPFRKADLGMASAFALLGVGLLWLVQSTGWGWPLQVFWPLACAFAGLGLIWWQADRVSSRAIKAQAGPGRWFAPLLAHWSSILVISVGLVLLGIAVAMVVVSQSQLGEIARMFLVIGLSVGALLVAVVPWFLRVRRSLTLAREEKLLSDARADMAAHLHDSVLQTLALIQRQAHDPKAVAALARRQERELRSWLYGEEVDESTLKTALIDAAADVEDDHGVPVEVVAVGDCELTTELGALVRAAREAMVNAAKHSGADEVDVFAEVVEDRVEVFVRDRGRGFDKDAVGEDRLGIKRSIVERLQRHGGMATIRTGPDEGTEVRLEMAI